MSSEEVARDRDTEFRRVLVKRAQRSPRELRRASWRSIVAVGASAVGAFALAGVLTGGAVASAASVSAQQATAEATAHFAAHQIVSIQDGTLLGAPVVRSGSRSVAIVGAHRPPGANEFVVGVDCEDAGNFHVDLGSGGGADFVCTGAQIRTQNGIGQGFSSSLDNQTAFVKVTSTGTARVTVWFSWAKVSTLKPSAQEQQEMADGTVSRAELLAALNREAVCTAAFGYTVKWTPASQSAISPFFMEPQSAITSGVANRCAETQDLAVDRQWVGEVQDGSTASASVLACLLQRNAEPAATAIDRAEQLAALDLNWQTTCAYVG
jgi:hypothetical protein